MRQRGTCPFVLEMNVRLLIQQSYRFAEIIAEDGENVDSRQLNTGLLLFNRLLRRVSIDGIQIPLISTETFTLIPDQRNFVLDGWTKLEKVQYLLGGVKLDIRLLNLNEFRRESRIQTTASIPYAAYPKRTPTGIDLLLFFAPSTDYEMTVDGYKLLLEATLETNLANIELFMSDYLETQLAIDLQSFYQLTPNLYLATQIESYLKKFKNIKEERIDVYTHRLSKDNDIYRDTPYLNLSGGWVP